MPLWPSKKDLNPGEILDGEGGCTVFGKLVRAADSIEHAYLPMGLTDGARVRRTVVRDTLLAYEDVDLDESQFSFKLRKSMEKGMIDQR
jgi:predicted homoserine dehydrogenase-like protein